MHGAFTPEMKLWSTPTSLPSLATPQSPLSDSRSDFPAYVRVTFNLDPPKIGFPREAGDQHQISLAFLYVSAESRHWTLPRNDADHEDTVTNGSDGAVHCSLSVCGTT